MTPFLQLTPESAQRMWLKKDWPIREIQVQEVLYCIEAIKDEIKYRQLARYRLEADQEAEVASYWAALAEDSILSDKYIPKKHRQP